MIKLRNSQYLYKANQTSSDVLQMAMNLIVFWFLLHLMVEIQNLLHSHMVSLAKACFWHKMVQYKGLIETQIAWTIFLQDNQLDLKPKDKELIQITWTHLSTSTISSKPFLITGRIISHASMEGLQEIPLSALASLSTNQTLKSTKRRYIDSQTAQMMFL